MVLSNTAIRRHVQDGLISVKPYFDPRHMRPFGLRVHLGSEILVPQPNQSVDLSRRDATEPRYEKVSIESSPLILRPGDFVLASTVEAFRMDRGLICKLDGRSTLARLGLMIHCTAEIIDGTHRRHRSIVLELANIGPFEISIPHHYAIGMVVFETVSDRIDPTHEQDQYDNQTTVLPPNLAFDTPEWLEQDPTLREDPISRLRRAIRGAVANGQGLQRIQTLLRP